MITSVIVELVPPHTGQAFEAIVVLRPAFTTRDELVRRVDTVQRAAGYRLVAAFTADRDHDADQPAAAVAGFRIGENLAWGRHLYVDDLATVPAARGQGYAAALLGWLRDEATRTGCRQLHLDSGVGTDRTAAHRLYLNHGYRISSHHFSRDV